MESSFIVPVRGASLETFFPIFQMKSKKASDFEAREQKIVAVKPGFAWQSSELSGDF